MTTMLVSIARMSHVPEGAELEQMKADHKAFFGAATDGDGPQILRCPNDPHEVAVVGMVNDIDEVRRLSRTPEGDALMRKYGFIEQLNFYTGAA